MQTIKTAAIVVLMLTVLYGGYVSLTTPPEPLPDEIIDGLVIEDPGAGEGSLIGDFDLDQPPSGMVAMPEPPVSESSRPPSFPTAMDSSNDSSNDLSNGSASPATLQAGGSKNAMAGNFADLPSAGQPSAGQRTATESASPRKLPPVTDAPPEVAVRPASAYASTSDQFAMPKPNSANDQFDPSKGTAFADSQAKSGDNGLSDPNGFRMSDQSPTTATGNLGSGNLDSADAPASPTANQSLLNAFRTADEMFAKGQLKEALATLSVFYGAPNLNQTQRDQLLSRLDPLAREVIYSKRHLLERPHRVSTSETLDQVAAEYKVPVQLLANINQVSDPTLVLPGKELKVVRGPFRAEVNLSANEMTLFLGDLYAGRFEIGVGSDPAPTTGTFTVQDKMLGKDFFGPGGVTLPAGSPENPYGDMWLDLGGQLCIHGSTNTVMPNTQGCISVAGDYADDVYGILSQGSSVTIRR